LKNYLKTALRNLKKHKGFSFINIFGLAVGMAVSMLILLYLRFELSYDKYHKNADLIYRVTQRFDTPTGYRPHFARCPDAWVNNLPDEFPEVKKLIRFQYQPQVDLRINDEKVKTYRWFTTDKEVFDVFSFPLVHGSSATALTEPHSVVLTESTALKYFGFVDVIGKEILLYGQRPGTSQPYKITGIMQNLPPNSHFQIDFLASYPNAEARQGWAWVYILLKQGADPSLLEEKFPSFIEKTAGASTAETTFLHLQALTDIHLKSHLDREIESNGDIRTITIFSVVAVLIMLIACFNFMNLSTARSMKRAKEIGIRKVLGAYRGQLILYFLNESLLYSLIAFIIALLIVIFVFPFFNPILEKKMELGSIFDGWLLFGFLGLCLFTGLFSGSYPSFVLSSFHPVNALFGSNHPIRSSRRLSTDVRKVLVVLQFTMSIALIVCTLISRHQYSFLSNTNLGMNKKQMLTIRNISHEIRTKYPVLKKEFTEHPGIINVSASMDAPSRDILDAGHCRVEGLPHDTNPPVLAVQSVDANFINFMEIEMTTGRDFTMTRSCELPVMGDPNEWLPTIQSYVLEKERTYLINESALKTFGWNDPREAIGKRIDWRNAAFQTKYGEIIGVVKDYHYASLRLQIRPLVLINEPMFFSCILVKLNTNNMTASLSHMKNVWDRLFPDLPFHYDFVDDLFSELYRTEQKQGRLLALFSTLTIFIAYLGLFGLTLFTAEQRTREIGIRKVMGASIPNILSLLFREFTKWILIAAVFASGLAYWAMTQWLQNYAYHITIDWWPFFTATVLALIIAILTVSYQSIKTATADPVDSLRYE